MIRNIVSFNTYILQWLFLLYNNVEDYYPKYDCIGNSDGLHAGVEVLWCVLNGVRIPVEFFFNSKV